MKATRYKSAFTLLEALVGMTLAALLTTVLLYLWLSVGRHSVMIEQKIGVRDEAHLILSRIELDTKKASQDSVYVASSGTDSRMSLQYFSGTARDGLLNWSPRASFYEFSSEEKVLLRWEDVMTNNPSPTPRPRSLTPDELLSFNSGEGEFLRTWSMVEEATFSKPAGLATLVVKLVLRAEGPRKRGYRFETQRGFLLMNGYAP